MPLMKALKTFRVGNTELVVSPGVEFETTRGAEYERRGMAVPVAPRRFRPANLADNKAAQSGPLASPGGETGAEALPLSHQGQVPQKSRSKKLETAPDSSQ
jgi:hypothetical protein